MTLFDNVVFVVYSLNYAGQDFCLEDVFKKENDAVKEKKRLEISNPARLYFAEIMELK